MSLNRAINIDWVNDVRIVQEFRKIGDKGWILSEDDVSVEFGITPDLPGIYGQREVTFSHFRIDRPIPDSVFAGPEKIVKPDPRAELPGYWDSARVNMLPEAEGRLYSIVDSIKTLPAFRRRMNVVMLLTTGFWNFGKVEAGPVGTFFSYNEIEGPRIRFGGRTTYDFSNRFYIDSYLAYGFRDEKYKYNAGLTYSLSGKSIYEFPVRSVGISYRYETETPGIQLDYASQDYLLFSFKRGVDDKVLYNRTFKMNYRNELANHFSWDLGYNYTTLTPGGNLFFDLPENTVSGTEIPMITTAGDLPESQICPERGVLPGKTLQKPATLQVSRDPF